MPDYNTNQKLDGSGQHGYACRRITRGKSAGKFTIEYGLAERDGPACRSHIVRGTVEEADARQFCQESLIAFPEPPAPKPLPYTYSTFLAFLAVGEWFLPYERALWVRRPTFVCQQLHKRGILEQRPRGGVPPTSEQLMSWDVKDIHEYRLTAAAVLALNSLELFQSTKTGWAAWAEPVQHFYLNGSQLCSPAAHPTYASYQAQVTALVCERCQELLLVQQT